MTNLLPKSLLAALFFTGSAALAQDTETASDLNLGEPVGPELYVKDIIGSWEVQCINVAEGPERCQMNQRLMGPGGNQIAEISIFPVNDGGEAVAGATIAVPLMTALNQPLLIAVDDSVPRQYPYSVCNPQFCVAQVGFRVQEVEAFKEGTMGIIAITAFEAPQDGPIMIEMPLDGFTAAFEAINGE